MSNQKFTKYADRFYFENYKATNSEYGEFNSMIINSGFVDIDLFEYEEISSITKNWRCNNETL